MDRNSNRSGAARPAGGAPVPTVRRDTVVVGASAGGPSTLTRLIGQLPADLPATVLVVQHQATAAPGRMAQMLAASARLPVKSAQHGEPLRLGQVYVAPPDHHLLIGEDGRVVLTRGARENRARPAIDPLFRSAAAYRSSRTVAVLLTGLLDDGVAGLAAVRRCGGVTVVQDPRDAAFPDLPRNALAAVEVDHVAALDDIGPLLAGLLGREVAPAEVPRDVRIEAQLAATPGTVRAANLLDIGSPTSFTCPDCGGAVWSVGDGDSASYRCHTGHTNSARSMLDGQAEEVEGALWVAVRTLQERVAMLRKMAREARARGRAASAGQLDERADEAETHAAQVRSFLVGLEPGAAPEAGPAATAAMARPSGVPAVSS